MSEKRNTTMNLEDWRPTATAEYERLYAIISPELHPYLEDHAALGQLMDKVREGYSREVYAQALEVIGEELDHHFLDEERLLLHYLEKHIPATDAGPAFKLRQEHEVIRTRHAEATRLFAAQDEANRDELIAKMNLLAYLLKKHIEKEDHYLFPMASAILTQEEKAAIERELVK